MNPLLAKFLGSLLRSGLQGVGAFLISKDIITATDWTGYLDGFVVFAVGMLWSLWEKYASRADFLNALAAPATASETEVKAMSDPPLAVVAKKAVALFLAVGLAGSVTACSSRPTRNGQRIAPEAEAALRLTQVVGALNALTVPPGNSPVERLIAAKVITNADGQIVATVIKESMGYAKDAGLMLEASLTARTEADKERGWMRASVLIRSLADKLASAPISIGTPEARKAVVDLLRLASSMVLTVGSFLPVPAPEGPPPSLDDALLVF